MGSVKEKIQKYRGIFWLLTICMVIHLISQVQYHLHHDDTSHENGVHVMDYHPVTDSHPDEHSPHESTHEFKSTPDVILKKNITPESIYIPVVFLFLIVAAIQYRSHISPASPRGKLYRYLYYGLAPPLRAPPAI